MEPLVLDRFSRVNESVAPELLKQDELVSLVDGVLDINTGKIMKRGAFTAFNGNSVGAGLKFQSIYDVVDSAGSNFLVGNAGTGVYTSAAGTAAWSLPIKTSLTAGYKCRIAALSNSRFAMTNGQDAPFIVGGANLTSNNSALAIDRSDVSGITFTTTPDPTLTYGKKSGTGINTVGNYRWILVFITDTGEMSNISLPFTCSDSTKVPTINDGTYNYCLLGSLPVSVDPRVTGRLLFRTPVNGQAYYLVAQLDNVHTEYMDGVQDADLDTSYQINYFNVPQTAKYECIHKDRLVLANLTKKIVNITTPVVVNISYSIYGMMVTTAAGGSLTTSSVYQYKLTFLDSNGNESDATPAVSGNTATFTGLQFYWNFKASIGASANIDPTISAIRIYRTKAAGSTFYWLADVDPSLLSYVDGAADTSLSTVYPKSSSYASMPPITLKSYIAWSDPLLYANFNELSLLQVFSDDGDEITGIFDDQDGILVFKKKSIIKIYTDPNPLSWQPVKLSENIGCTDPESIIKNDNEYFFKSGNNIYLFSSNGGIKLISEIFKNSIALITNVYAGAYSTLKKWYVIAVLANSANYLYAYDTKLDTWYKFVVGDVEALVEKRINNNGTLLLGLLSVIAQYNESSSVDIIDDSLATQEILISGRTKSFAMNDGISYIRLRHLLMNYNKKASQSAFIRWNNPDTNSGDTYTDSTGSGWKDVKNIEQLMTTHNLSTVNKIYFTFGNPGLIELGAIRLEYRVIRKGYGVGV